MNCSKRMLSKRDVQKTTHFDKLIKFAKSRKDLYPTLHVSLSQLDQFVGFEGVKETLAKQIQFFICHHLTQVPSRRSSRKRKSRFGSRSASKRSRAGSTDDDEEEEEEDDRHKAAATALVRLFARAIESESESDSDSDYEEEDDESIKKCGKLLKLLDGHFLHTMLVGPPGVGKTTFAKILADVWASLGICDAKKFRVTRRSDWVARYTGQSVAKAKKLISSCKGGVIFIDEAYSLVMSTTDDYGFEVMTEIVEAMSNPDRQVIFIFAGYTEEMKKLFKANSGFERRLGYTFHFPKPNIQMIMEIFISQMKKDKWKMARDERIKTAAIFQKHRDKFKNAGGTTKNLLFYAKQHAVMTIFPKPIQKLLVSKDVVYAFNALQTHRQLMNKSSVLEHMYL